MILKYDDNSKQFEIVYEGDDAHYYFDLSQDVMLGDLVLNAWFFEIIILLHPSFSQSLTLICFYNEKNNFRAVYL